MRRTRAGTIRRQDDDGGSDFRARSARAPERLDAARAAGSGAVLLVAIRVWCAFTPGVNSDEPQHLHVVWELTQGQVPYRDVFDNHARGASIPAGTCWWRQTTAHLR